MVRIINKKYNQLYNIFADKSVGYDSNGYVWKPTDLTCEMLYDNGIKQTEVSLKICTWLLSIIGEPNCYRNTWYDSSKILSCEE